MLCLLTKTSCPLRRTLAKAFLDRSKPLATHYGAIVGLAALGPHVVRTLLVPHAEPYVTEVLQPALEEGASSARRAEAARCHATLVSAIASAMYDRITQRVADRLPLHALALPRAGRPAAPPLRAGAAAAATSSTSAAAAAAMGRRAPAAEPRPIREVLADAWREDCDLDEVLSALCELFGEPFVALMHAPAPATAVL